MKIRKLAAILAAVSVLAASASFTGCAGAAAKEVNVFCWTEYFPESLLDKFEDETGIHVNFSTYSSNEDMLNKVKAEAEGTYDICIPSDYMIDMMVDQDLLEELDTDKLTNLGNIDESYLGQYFDPDNNYSVPYMAGACTLAVNTDKVTDPITSYADIFDPKYSGQIVVLDDFRAVIGLAAKTLGYTMSETDPGKLAEISTKLMELKPNVVALDSDNPKGLLIEGEASIAYIWSAEIALAAAENPAIEIVFPEEGMYLFQDGMVIPKGAKNYDNAIAFINFVLDGENSAEISREFPYLNPNTAAAEILGEEFLSNKAANPPAEEIAKGEYVLEVGDVISEYDNMWTEFTK